MNPIGRRLTSSVLSSNEIACTSSTSREVQNCYGCSSEESSARYGMSSRNSMKFERQWTFNEDYMVDSILENGQSEQANTLFPERVSISGGSSFHSKNRPLLAHGSSSSASSSSRHATFNLNSSSRYPVDFTTTHMNPNSVEERNEDSSSLHYSDIPGTSSDTLSTFHHESGSSCLYPRNVDSSCKREPLDSSSENFYSGESSSNNSQIEPDLLQLGRNRHNGSGMLCSCPQQNARSLAGWGDLCPRSLFDARFSPESSPVIPLCMLRNSSSRPDQGIQEPSSAFSGPSGISRSGGQWFPRQNDRISTIDSGDLRSTNLLASCISNSNTLQNQTPPIRGSSSSRNTTPGQWTGSLDLTAASSRGWYTPSYETDLLSHGDSNQRNMRRHGFDHPMYMSATEMRNINQDPTTWSVSPGHYEIAPYMRTFPNSNVHTVPSFPWSPQRQPSSGNWQRYSDSPSWSLFPPMEAEFSGYPINSMSSRQSSPSASASLRFRALRRRPLPVEGEYEERRSLFHNQRLSADNFEGTSHLVISEIRHILTALERGEPLTDEDYLLLDPVYQTMSEIHDRHRDMRLDVDNMSYEELLALEERIGNVSTGLSDETILKLMKRTKFAASTGDDGSCDSHEPCCICQEEFLNEEDIGGLECGHTFHFDCIKEWLYVKNLCPICKMNGLPA